VSFQVFGWSGKPGNTAAEISAIGCNRRLSDGGWDIAETPTADWESLEETGGNAEALQQDRLYQFPHHGWIATSSQNLRTSGSRRFCAAYIHFRV
jgi:hypothetical protein